MDKEKFGWAVSLAAGALAGGSCETADEALEFAVECYKGLGKAMEECRAEEPEPWD